MHRDDFFKYTQKELDALSKKDKKLAAAISRIGNIKRKTNKDVFSALIDSIVSQQISNKAAETVGNKLLSLCGEITSGRIHGTDIADIQKCGMSMRKAQYIKNAGEAVLSGGLNLAAFTDMSDTEVIERLSALPGIGVWTAEIHGRFRHNGNNKMDMRLLCCRLIKA